MRSALLFIALLLFSLNSWAQELDCQITIQTPKLQTADPSLFKNLEDALNDFMNNKSWTDFTFESHERIQCQIVITITEEVSANEFKAEANIQSSRPVYNSDYSTVILNHADRQFNFEYSQYQPIEFSENVFLNNLSSLLGYYAFIIIGMDFDTFKEEGGTPFYQKAKTIVNQAQTSDNKGWKSYEGTRNRFWLVDNLLSPGFSQFRKGMYEYHFEGLDKMYDNRSQATSAIVSALEKFRKVEKNYPNSMIMQLFRNAKKDEIMTIFENASPTQKTAAVNNMRKIDPSNASKYEKLLN